MQSSICGVGGLFANGSNEAYDLFFEKILEELEGIDEHWFYHCFDFEEKEITFQSSKDDMYYCARFLDHKIKFTNLDYNLIFELSYDVGMEFIKRNV